MKETIDMIEAIFDIATTEEFNQDTVDYYERKYKTFVLEELADYLQHIGADEDAEDSILMNYNQHNLVKYFLK